MKTAASPLNQGQLLITPTSVSHSTKRTTPLLLQTVTETSTARLVDPYQEHLRAGRVQEVDDAQSWCCSAAVRSWQPSDWGATC